MKFGIGQPLKRIEDNRLLTGNAVYTDDISFINQSYLYNGLEAYAWSSGVIEISKSSFPFIGNNESHLSCLISHELAHLLKNHRHKKLVEVSKGHFVQLSRSSVKDFKKYAHLVDY